MTRNAAPDDRGAVLVWVSIMMVALLAIAALAVDLGYGFAVKRKLSATADAAALAGAQEAGLRFLEVGGCGPDLETVSIAAAEATYNESRPPGSLDPEVYVNCFDKDGDPVTTGTGATSVEVQVDDRSSLRTFFSRVLGFSTLSPAATATASVTGTNQLEGLRPFLVCREDAVIARDAFAEKNKPIMQSFYKKGGKNQVAASGDSLLGTTWDESTDQITQDNKQFDDLNYVRLVNVEAEGDDVADRFYYVRDAKQKSFKVSLTSNGGAVDVTTSGTVDVYKQPRDATGTWSSDSTFVTLTDHGLKVDTEVWVQVTSPVTGSGVEDGLAIVTSTGPANNQLELSQGTDVIAPSTSVTANLYILATPEEGTGDCSPPSASGNWGYSKFDLGDGDNFQLACLIKYGYGGGSGTGKPDGSECEDPTPDEPGVNVGDPSTGGVTPGGDPGNNLGATQDGPLIKALVVSGEPVLLPVGAGWVEANGGNAKYNGFGAVAVKLCGYAFPGNQIDPSSPAPPGDPASFFGSCGSQSLYETAVVSGDVTKDTTLVIQWQYTTWVGGPQGASASANTCPLDRCLAALQLIK